MKQRFIDLSHTISPKMSVYPGTKPPVFESGTTVADDGFAEMRIALYTHTGTHIDVPAHLFDDGATVDALPVGLFLGKAMVIDVRGRAEIDTAVLKEHMDALAQAQYVVLRTGWQQHWGTAKYFEGYPVLTEPAARLLAGSPLAGVGVDAISLDRLDAEHLPNHRILLGEGKVIVENLTNLDELPKSVFHLSVLPWKLQAGDGSPVRAIAVADAEDIRTGPFSP